MELTGTGNFPKAKSPQRKHTEDDSMDEDEMRDTVVVFEKLNISKTERTSVSQLHETDTHKAAK